MKITYLEACLLSLPLALSTSFGAQGNNDIQVNGYSDIITFDGPVAYYRFEETTGDKTKNFGTGGTANDGVWKVGTGPDDSSAGTASVEAGPRPPDFKGFEAANNAGKFLGPDATLWVDAQGQLLNNLAAFSLEYRVRPANRVADPTTFGTRIGIVGQNDAVEYGFIDPNTIQIWTPGGGSLNTTYSFPDNTWHHVATIATGSDIRNYFDGVLVGTGGSAAANYGSSAFNVHIGGGGVYDGTGNFFTGDIDEVAIFDKAIPAERIVQHFKAGKEGAFSVPFINEPSGTITDFTIEVKDFAPIIADTNTIVLSLNGTVVTPTSVTKSGTTTTVKYAPPSPFPSQSVQNTSMSINDKNGITYTDAGSFTAPYYGTITASSKVTNADTSKPGFVWNVFQNEADQSNSNARAEKEVAGDMTNADGTPMPNLADPNATGTALAVGTPASPGSKAIHFEIADVINMSQAGGESNGNFPDDGQMPGIPGTSGSTDGIGAEVIAWVELPKGWVTMGVNSDDGFATAAGLTGDRFLEISLGVADVGRGASDTIFKFLVEEAGVYKLRTIWEEGGGGANIEWFTVKDDGTKVLLNDTANGGFKTYRAITGTEPSVAKVTRVVPAINAAAANPNLVAVDIRDGATPIDKSTVSLKVDGAAVAANVSKTGALTTAAYTANPLFASGSKHQATVEYTEGGNKISRDWQFTVSTYTATLDTVNKYAGLLRGPAQFTPDAGGHTGKAGDYAIDSTPSGGGWVDIEDVSFLDPAAPNDQLSMALWVKKYDIVNGSAFWATLSAAPSGTDTRGFQAHIPWSDDTIYFDTGGCCDGTTQRISANISTFPAYVDDDTFWKKWHHFVFTKKADQKNIYIDGQLFLNGSSSNPLEPKFVGLGLLTDGIPGGDFMHGLIDDFAVFSTEISAGDAAKLAGGTSPKDLTGETLIAYWPFDDAVPVGGNVKITAALAAGGNITLTWTGNGTLQSAPAVTGPWTNQAGKTSPATVPASGQAEFFRVSGQ